MAQRPLEERVTVGAIRLRDALFVGDEFAAADLDFLNANGIRFIVNASLPQVPSYFQESKLLSNTLQPKNSTDASINSIANTTSNTNKTDDITDGDGRPDDKRRAHDAGLNFRFRYLNFKWTTDDFFASTDIEKVPSATLRSLARSPLIPADSREAIERPGGEAARTGEADDPTNAAKAANAADLPTKETTTNLERFLAFCEKAEDAEEGLLIHSLRGYTRAPALACLFMMSRYRWRARKAIEFLLAKNPHFSFTRSMIRSFLRLQARLTTVMPSKPLSSSWYSEGENGETLSTEELLLRNTFRNMFSPVHTWRDEQAGRLRNALTGGADISSTTDVPGSETRSAYQEEGKKKETGNRRVRFEDSPASSLPPLSSSTTATSLQQNSDCFPEKNSAPIATDGGGVALEVSNESDDPTRGEDAEGQGEEDERMERRAAERPPTSTLNPGLGENVREEVGAGFGSGFGFGSGYGSGFGVDEDLRNIHCIVRSATVSLPVIEGFARELSWGLQRPVAARRRSNSLNNLDAPSPPSPVSNRVPVSSRVAVSNRVPVSNRVLPIGGALGGDRGGLLALSLIRNAPAHARRKARDYDIAASSQLHTAHTRTPATHMHKPATHIHTPVTRTRIPLPHSKAHIHTALD